MLGELILQDSLILTKDVHYGPDFPTDTTEGQIFFLEDDGISLPLGGEAGQILSKKSDKDNDAEWIDYIECLPIAGGNMQGVIKRNTFST